MAGYRWLRSCENFIELAADKREIKQQYSSAFIGGQHLLGIHFGYRCPYPNTYGNLRRILRVIFRYFPL